VMCSSCPNRGSDLCRTSSSKYSRKSGGYGASAGTRLPAAWGVCVLGWLVVLIDVGVGYSNNIARTAGERAGVTTISRAGLDFAVGRRHEVYRDLTW